MRWNDIPVFPSLGPDYGNSTLPQHAKRFFGSDRGLVITLCDVWPLSIPAMRDLNLACWTPVDHEPAPPRVYDFLVQSGAVPIAMTRFGEQMLSLLDPLMVPHGVSTSVYRPLEQSGVRKKSFPENAFVVGMVAANKGHPSRKGFAQALRAFAEFSRRCDDAFLYLHTVLDGNYAMGEDLSALIEMLGIRRDRLRVADQYALMHAPYTPATMAEIYNSLDVLMNPSFGEGFGLTVLESQSCGIPAIVTDFTAMREVCGAGWRVGHEPYWSAQDSWQAVAHVGEIVAALEECYSMPAEDRRMLSRRARDHALLYDRDRVWERYWLPTLRATEQRLFEADPVEIPAREMVAA